MTVSSASHQVHMMSQEHLELRGRRNGIAHLLRFTIDITNSSCKGNSWVKLNSLKYITVSDRNVCRERHTPLIHG
jgi:hypothetical protein